MAWASYLLLDIFQRNVLTTILQTGEFAVAVDGLVDNFRSCFADNILSIIGMFT